MCCPQHVASHTVKCCRAKADKASRHSLDVSWKKVQFPLRFILQPSKQLSLNWLYFGADTKSIHIYIIYTSLMINNCASQGSKKRPKRPHENNKIMYQIPRLAASCCAYDTPLVPRPPVPTEHVRC